VTDHIDAHPADGLWSRLRLIEGQPLTDRADAYTAVHDELFRRLEAGAKLDSREKSPSGDR